MNTNCRQLALFIYNIKAKMEKKFINIKVIMRHGLLHTIVLGVCLAPLSLFGQSKCEMAVNELLNLGFENIRCTETENERIYSIENNIYKAQGVGISKAIDVIQKNGLPSNKMCKIIITHLDNPEVLLTYQPIGSDTTSVGKEHWQIGYELGNSWKEVKKEKAKNSSRFKVDIVVYPQLSYKNLIITQIYQALFTLNPAIEVSFWRGMKFTGQIIVPVYNDGYGVLQDKVHPGFITLSQRFRLPYNIKGKASIGYFNANRYGADVSIFRPFNFDSRFSLEGRVGYTGIGYWNGFKLHYDKIEDMIWTWSIGANYYWSQYNTQFSLKGEQYFLGEKGVKFEVIRHFRYASVGFYAMKAEKAKSNGGFRFQVLLPPYKYKRLKGRNKYIPRINTSHQMGIAYNAGNERIYYKQYRSEANENIMNNNSFNPYFIKSEITNY